MAISDENRKLLNQYSEQRKCENLVIMNEALTDYFRAKVISGELLIDNLPSSLTIKGRNVSETVKQLSIIDIGQTVRLPLEEYKSVFVRAKRLGIKIRAKKYPECFYVTRIA
jgi:hypothetical protein